MYSAYYNILDISLEHFLNYLYHFYYLETILFSSSDSEDDNDKKDNELKKTKNEIIKSYKELKEILKDDDNDLYYELLNNINQMIIQLE